MGELAKYCGPLLKMTAVGHTLYGVVWYRNELVSLADRPLFGLLPVVEHRYPEEAVVLFFLLTPVLVLAGLLADWAHDLTGALPRSVGWWLLGTGAVLGALAPLSGAVLAIGLGIFWLRATRVSA